MADPISTAAYVPSSTAAGAGGWQFKGLPLGPWYDAYCRGLPLPDKSIQKGFRLLRALGPAAPGRLSWKQEAGVKSLRGPGNARGGEKCHSHYERSFQALAASNKYILALDRPELGELTYTYEAAMQQGDSEQLQISEAHNLQVCGGNAEVRKLVKGKGKATAEPDAETRRTQVSFDR
ncbi:hypothetical protein IAU59_005800 [Kwoniella sp. CBS 9459]